MSNGQLIKIVVACFLMLEIPIAHAGNWYIGAGVGVSTADSVEGLDDLKAIGAQLENDPGFDATALIDDEDSASKLFLGYNSSDSLAFEGGLLDMGKVLNIDIDALDTAGTFAGDVTTIDANTEIDGVYFAAIGKIPVLGLLSLKGKAGVYMWDASGSINTFDTTLGSASDSVTDNGSDIFYGVGVDIWWIGVDYEVYDIDGDKINYLGASISLQF